MNEILIKYNHKTEFYEVIINEKVITKAKTLSKVTKSLMKYIKGQE